MSLNFNQILHQMRFKLLNSTAPTNNTPPVTLPNSDQLTKTSFLKRKIQAIYKSRSNDIKFTAGIGSVLNGSWFSKRTDPSVIPLFHRKKFLIAVFTLIFISLPIAFISLRNARPTIAAWFDDSWAYRKAITIPSHTSTETNVYVTVPSFDATDTTKFQADCGDLRFTKQNGELLPYYVVDCDATATVHVQFDSLPAGASTYFMYYGNPTADNGFSAADFATAASGLGDQTLASEEQSQGPVAYWKFDDGTGTNAQDSTSNNNDGSISGATWQTEDQCISSKCLYFDGSNDVVTVSNTVSGIKTVSFWVKPITTSEQFIDLNGSAYIQASSGTISATGFTDPTIYVDGQVSSIIVANKWQYVTVTTGTALSGSAIKIGQISTNYGQGFVDDVKIYPYARTAAQIKSDYASRGSVKGTSAALGGSKDNLDALSNGLFRYWKMDESVANTCAGGVNDSCDSSGNASNGAWNGDVTSATGKFGNGTTYDGTGDYVDIPDYNPGTDNFTLTAWFNLSSADSASGNPHAIFGNDQNTPMLGYTPSNKTFTQLRQYSGGSESLTFSATSSNLADSLWHHVVVTIDQQTYKVRLYVDGTFLQEKSIGTEGYTHSNGAFQKIGVGYIPSATTFWKGSIDEVRVYKRVLSGKEVRDLYNWAPGPAVHLKMDEGSGTSAYDSSGNANTGTLTNSPTWASGKYGKGVAFTASSNKTVRLSTNALAGYKAFTIGTWVYQSSATAGALFAASGGGQYWRSTNGTNFLLFMQPTSCTGASAWTVNSAISTGWHYYTLTIDSGGNLSFYKDGILFSTTTFSSTFGLTWDSTCTTSTHWTDIGNYAGANGWAGTLDEFKIYNYARTSKQIVEDMNAGHPAPGSPVGSAVGYWKFDDGYGTTVNNVGIGGTAFNGSLGVGTSAPSWTNQGKFGKALTFDGSNDYVSVSSVNPPNYVTVSAWFKRSGTPGNSYHIIYTQGTQIEISIPESTGEIRTGVTTATMGRQVFNSGSGLTNDNWHYVALTYDGSNLKSYIDGKQTASNPVSGALSTGSATTIGYLGGGYATNGLIDELKIYNSALTADEVALDYNRGSAMVMGALSTASDGTTADNSSTREYCIPGDTTSCNPPVDEWNLNEGIGTTANDIGTSLKPLPLGIGATAPEWRTGKIGKALYFDGNDGVGYNDGGTIAAITGPVTVNTWIKTNASTSGGIVCRYGNSSTWTFCLYMSSNGKVNFLRSSLTGPWSTNLASLTSINDNQWHYITARFDSSTMKIYIDGKEDNSVDETRTSNGSLWSFCIGNQHYLCDGTGYNGHFTGYIDQVRLFNYARTPAQIAWDYNRGGPVGWWKLDECQGITANDASGKGNNGTITIGATGTQSVLGTCSVGVGSTAAWGNGSVGKYNSSLNFDGTNDYVSSPITTSNSLDVKGPITYSVWFKRANSGTYQALISKLDTCTSAEADGFLIRFGTSNDLRFEGYKTGSVFTASYTNSSLFVDTTNWHHAVAVWDGTTGTNGAKLYVDGKLAAQATSSASDFISLTGYNQYIDTLPCNTQYFAGQIDDVRVYNYALTPTQVKTLYNENSSVRFGQ